MNHSCYCSTYRSTYCSSYRFSYCSSYRSSYRSACRSTCLVYNICSFLEVLFSVFALALTNSKL